MSTQPESTTKAQEVNVNTAENASVDVTTAAVGVAGEVVPSADASIGVGATAADISASATTIVPVVPPSEDTVSATTTTTTTATGTPDLTDTERDAVTVVITPPKSMEELVAARAIKRIAKKTALREAAEGHVRAGDAYMELKNYRFASTQYLEAIRLCHTDPEYFIRLAGSYRKLKWYEEAAHAATRALTLDPKNSEARYVRGVARLEQRLLKPAKIDFETVLAHEPTHLLARAAHTEVSHFISTSTHLGPHTLSSSPIDDIVKDVDFSFPAYDFEGVDEEEQSDSSDCAHAGNGVPCRFYNHEGCRRGGECVFSHAPDERSVRDDLGKNVCTYYLLSSCKFGAAKCIYSHDKSALPKRGWWTSEEQIERVRGVVEVAEKKAREQRERESERWKARVKGRSAAKEKAKAKAKGAEGKEGENEGAETAEGVKEKEKDVEGENEEPLKSPKSAGLRSGRAGKAKKQQSKPADDVGAGEKDEEPPKSAGVGAEKVKAKPRRKVTRKKKTLPPAAPDATVASAVPVASNVATAAASGEVENKSSGSEFTDYKLNGPPPAVVADNIVEAPVTLSY